MDHCWSNDYVLRLFKNQENIYFPDIPLHEELHIQGEIKQLKGYSINHYPYKDLNEYFSKFMKYSEIFAEYNVDKNKKVGLIKLLSAFPVTFIKLYIFKKGFLDGIQGFILVFLSSAHNFVKYSRLWEKRKK